MMDTLKKLSPQWWGAIAAATAAGASVFADHRILGGLALGGAMLALAVKVTPCCAGCADDATHEPTQATPAFDPMAYLSGLAGARASSSAAASPCPGCLS